MEKQGRRARRRGVRGDSPGWLLVNSFKSPRRLGPRAPSQVTVPAPRPRLERGTYRLGPELGQLSAHLAAGVAIEASRKASSRTLRSLTCIGVWGAVTLMVHTHRGTGPSATGDFSAQIRSLRAANSQVSASRNRSRPKRDPSRVPAPRPRLERGTYRLGGRFTHGLSCCVPGGWAVAHRLGCSSMSLGSAMSGARRASSPNSRAAKVSGF